MPEISIEERLQNRLDSLKNRQKYSNLQSEDSKSWIKQNLSLIGIPATQLESCVEILEKMANLKVIWLHMQECTGCSESFLRTQAPSFEVLIFDIFRIIYHDLVLAPSGLNANLSLEEAYCNEEYILLIEGSVPMNYAKDYITIGNRNGYDEVSHLIKKAKMLFAIGTCSSFGGIQTAYPNPTNGYAISELFSREIINIPGCPPSDKNIVASLLYYYLFESVPKLDSLKRPMWAYGKCVHDLCERKSFFMSGDFVEGFDDPNMANGYCLYKVGCKGPYTYNNCPKVKFNAKTSWPVQGGHGCIGCSEPNFWDNFGNIEKPLGNATFSRLNTKFLSQNVRTNIKNFKNVWEDSNTLDSIESNIESILDKKLYFTNKILNESEYLNFVKKHNLDSSILLDFRFSETKILRQNLDSINTISNFSFEINPKLILKSYESKNKQGKKLYENYKRVFNARYNSLQNLDESSIISTNLYDIFSLFFVILNESEISASEIFADSIESSSLHFREKIIKDFLHYANNFKFPYISELSSKFKFNDVMLSVDMTKALSIAMAYAIGGLDIYGVCYSVLCDTLNALSETLSEIDINTKTTDSIESKPAIILQGEIFESTLTKNIFKKHF